MSGQATVGQWTSPADPEALLRSVAMYEKRILTLAGLQPPDKIKKGDALAEVVNTLHNGRNTGKVPAKRAVFYAGASGLGLTVAEDPSAMPAL